MATLQTQIQSSTQVQISHNIPTVSKELTDLISAAPTPTTAVPSLVVRGQAAKVQVSAPRGYIKVLRQPLYTSQLQVQVDKEVQWGKLGQATCEGLFDQLVNHVNEENLNWVRGRSSKPRLGFILVSLSGSSKVEETPWICVTGINSKADMIYFHARLSETHIRSGYKPLRLCYLLEHNTLASSVKDLECFARVSYSLCGTLILTGPSNLSVSTLGGILWVDGQLVALTSAHSPELDESEQEKSIPNASARSSLNYGTEIPDPPVVIDPESWGFDDPVEQTHSSIEIASGISQHPQSLNDVTQSTPILHATSAPNSDWKLHQVGSELLRPNAFDPGPGHIYLNVIASTSFNSEVFVLSSSRQQTTGLLSATACYFKPSSSQSALKCWLVRLKSANCKLSLICNRVSNKSQKQLNKVILGHGWSIFGELFLGMLLDTLNIFVISFHCSIS
jgi:hypothetical protein